jgi:hypothetical protein
MYPHKLLKLTIEADCADVYLANGNLRVQQSPACCSMIIGEMATDHELMQANG